MTETPDSLMIVEPLVIGPGGPGRDPKKKIEDLRAQLWAALLNDPECLSFLGARGVGVLDMLDRIPITVSNEGDSTIAATTHYQLSDPSSVLPKDPTIHINENSYFFMNINQTLIKFCIKIISNLLNKFT